ncbi:MAG: 50S ribosomal protein L6 [Candidatus Aureabacteria bacterium]|nr:50S ribosomal protein L6 [Candidatus Auribacterota bacterium]
MSRIGKLPIMIPADVKVAINGQKVNVEGPKGKLEWIATDNISVKMEDNKIIVERPDDSKQMKAYHGLNRQLIANMIEGVTKGYSKKLTIVGTGFRSNVNGDVLEMLLGYSHPIHHKIPKGITIKVEKNVEIEVSGIDKQLVGETAACLRSYYPPEPYKGKGVRYSDEHVKRKAGKTVA